MFGVITDGSHQYKVKTGEAFKCNKLPLEVGATVSFKPILVSDGVSLLDQSLYVVNGVVIKQYREKKIIVFKKKRRKDYKRKRGHRSFTTLVRVESISII